MAWRLAHSEVVVGADLVGGRLVLTGFGGQVDRPRSDDRTDRRLTVPRRGLWTGCG